MKRMTCLTAMVVATLAAAVWAEETLTADAIMAKANQAFYYAGADGRSDVLMSIHDAQGGTRTRELTILRRNEGEDQKFYVYFKAPADVRKMAYLVWKKTGGDDDRWLFLPALNLEKRIAPGDKRTSFAGSDFYYEDVSGRSLKEDSHELAETTDKAYVILNKPKDPKAVEFASYKVWVDKTTFLPMKSEYVDANGKVIRIIESEKVETIDGLPTVVSAVAKDVAAGTFTRNEFSKVKYGVGLNPAIFTQRFLRRPPREATE
jgi:outer membrane lipoprotein-sorting protein